MSSREKILQAIKQNKPAFLPLPETFSVAAKTENIVETFSNVLRSIGGTVTNSDGLADVEAFLLQKKEDGTEVVNGIEALPHFNIEAYAEKEAAEVESVNTVLLKGGVAVAENGAVWLTESKMVNRLLPFICQELILVVSKENVVANMHQAYKKITVDQDGFGVFIAGPSKTADIEQSLVIGAHGPLALQVFLV